MTPTHRSDDMTDTLREALTFYARYEGWDEYDPAGCDQTIIKDGGDIARAALAAAPQPADRKALVDVIAAALWQWRADDNASSSSPVAIADALLARGLPLPGGNETMAWAVVGEDGAVNVNSIFPEERWSRTEVRAPGERVARVAIRVVEGGDDAA